MDYLWTSGLTTTSASIEHLRPALSDHDPVIAEIHPAAGAAAPRAYGDAPAPPQVKFELPTWSVHPLCGLAALWSWDWDLWNQRERALEAISK